MIPSVAHHFFYFPSGNITILLALDVIISYFLCCKPRGEIPSSPHMLLFLTPQRDLWNPHDSSYQQQEEVMVDFKGDIKQPPPTKFIVPTILSSTKEPSLYSSEL